MMLARPAAALGAAFALALAFEEGVTALHHTVLRMAGEKVVEPNAINAADKLKL